jgi:hypothetical protein
MVSADLALAFPKPLGVTRPGRGRVRGADLSETTARLRRRLFGWQAYAARVGLERRRDRWRYPLVTMCVPRQSGKTTLLMALAVHRCLSQPDAQVWYTAQSRQDAIMRWREMIRSLRRSDLSEALPRAHVPAGGADYRVWTTTGYESVEFANGSQLRVFAPAEDSLHGSVTDLVILDEARFFDEARGSALMAAVLPTQATRDGQVWIASTAGGPYSVFLARQLEAGRASLGGLSRRAHFEWGIGPGPVADDDLLEAVWRAHPSAGLPGGIGRDALAVAADSMPAWQFAHEFGNRWSSAADERLLSAPVWERSQADAPMGAGSPCFGVDVAVDRSAGAVVACVDGVAQLVDYRAGAGWVAGRVRELVDRWQPVAVVVDAAGPAGSVAEELRPVLGDLLVTTSSRELAAACGGFYDALHADPPDVWHRPSATLDESVAGAAKRKMGQAWVFSRVDSGPALLALVLAWWGERRASLAPDESPAVFV